MYIKIFSSIHLCIVFIVNQPHTPCPLPTVHTVLVHGVGGGGGRKYALLFKHHILYAYKFSRDVYFANTPHLTIFAILIMQMTACNCKLSLYRMCTNFRIFIFANTCRFAKFTKIKSHENLYTFGIDVNS